MRNSAGLFICTTGRVNTPCVLSTFPGVEWFIQSPKRVEVSHEGTTCTTLVRAGWARFDRIRITPGSTGLGRSRHARRSREHAQWHVSECSFEYRSSGRKLRSPEGNVSYSYLGPIRLRRISSGGGNAKDATLHGLSPLSKQLC